MAIQQWTMEQWRLAYEMTHSNEWSLRRFIDKDQDSQTDVCLIVYGCPLELAEGRQKAFGGLVSSRHSDWVPRKVARQPFVWILKDKELDDFLDNLWIILSKEDRHGRLSDVRMAQDIRRKVREGCSYPFYHPKAAKRP